MLSLSDYSGVKLGERAHEQFICDYYVTVSLDWSDKFDAKGFVSALFKNTDNPKVYCKILENLILVECLPKHFNETLNQIVKSIIKNTQIKKKELEFSLKQFIRRNKPFAITDLVNLDYKVNIIKGEDKRNISFIKYDDKYIDLVQGNTDFNFNLIKSSYYDKLVRFPEFGTVHGFEVDHFCREINLIC